MTDFRIGDKVRLRSTGQIGHVETVDTMTGAPCVRFEDNPHHVTCCITPTDYDDLEVLEAIARRSPYKQDK